ncbi:MAG TPA: 50S ribosomal protein L27 [Caldisericia bacterium]|nr:50S ribosomal protein L27 [Caldisericia bacterium]
MARKKGGSKAKNGRDSNPKYLGVKTFEGEFVKPGYIIVRQRGTKIHPGINTSMGNDYTIFSLTEGYIKFEKYRGKKRVSVYSQKL